MRHQASSPSYDSVFGTMLRMIEGERRADRNNPRFRVEASEVRWNHGPLFGHTTRNRLRMLENRNQGSSAVMAVMSWCFA